MSEIYDNWERLVRATIRREEDRRIAMRAFSDCSLLSATTSFTDSSRSASSFNFSPVTVADYFTYPQNLQATDYLSGSNLIEDGHSNYSLTGALFDAIPRAVVKNSILAFRNETQSHYLNEQRKYMQHSQANRPEVFRGSAKQALAVLKELIYEADDLVVDCMIREDYQKMKGASSFHLSPSEMFFRYETGKKLTEINRQIKTMCENLNSYYTPIAMHKMIRWSSPVFDPSETVGLTEDVATIRGWIFDHDEPLLCVGIVGLGGLGKTTLAKMIYRDVHLTKRFQKKIWVSVSQPVNMGEILKSMLKQLKAHDRGLSTGGMLSKLLSDKTYLIVLDNVWSIEDGWWEEISRGLPKTEGLNNCIIITSRTKKVVKKMGVRDAQIHQPRLLEDYESWILFCKAARMSEEDEQNTKLVEKGKEIVKKCGGHPLAIKTIGRLLLSEEKSYTEWTRINNSFHEKLTTTEGNRDEGNQQVNVIASVQLSYDELPAFLKPCVLCFSIYPENHEVDVNQLIHWWVGEGFVHGTSTKTSTESAFECLSELISRGLVEVAKRRDFDGSVYTCKVHDIVRDLTIKIAREEDFCSFNENGKHIANVSSRRLGVTKDTLFQSLRGNSKLRALLLTATDRIGFNRNIELAKVKSLRVLDLSHVKLDSICDKDLWHWITSLKRLAYLSLRYVAKLFEIPDSIGKLWGLQVLILGECKDLKKLPPSLVNLPRLIILDVGNCTSLRSVPQGFSRLSKLQELYGFKIAGTGNADGSHLGELRALTELRVLHIDITEGSTIDDQELEVLAQLEKLRLLSINAGDCEDKGILSKLNKLSSPSSIEELYLKHYVGETTPGWINPKSLRQLRYLSVENSTINKMNQHFWGDEEHKWDVEGLCLKFCQRLQMSWEELQAVMPKIRYLEVSQCNLLKSFPCDVEDVGFWYKDEKKKDVSRRMFSVKRIESS